MIHQDNQRVIQTIELGTCAFQTFSGCLRDGDWSKFLALLTEDFEFFFPAGPYQGMHKGKKVAEEFFAYVKTRFPLGIAVTELIHMTANERTAVFEFKDEGWLDDALYKNRVAVSFTFRDGLICEYREYFGSDGKSN